MAFTPSLAANVLGEPLEACGFDPVTGFFRDGACHTSPEDLGSHTICAVMTADFLAHQRELGNDLVTPRPEYGFPGLRPGDRWCVVAFRWLQSAAVDRAAPVVLASTHLRTLEAHPRPPRRRGRAPPPPPPSPLL